MPRVPAPPKVPASAALGRKPKGAVAAAAASTAPSRSAADPPEKHEQVCPLCVEELDATDLEFQPCPCGYRVCLFCFEKLKLLCNSACPNCRRGYGSDEALQYAKQLEEERALEALRPKPPTPPGTNQATASGAGAGGAAVATARALAKPTAALALRRDGHLAPAKRSSGALADAEALASQPSLPSGATWAAASPMTLSRNQSVEIERPALAMDEASWPSLASAQPPPPPHGHAAPSQQQQQHTNHHRYKSQDTNGEGATRRSSSIASSSMDRVASSSSLDLMSQDPPVTPEQLAQLQHQHQQYQAQHAGAATASLAASSSSFTSVPPGFEGAMGSYFGAQVTTTVNGVRRAVNVPLSLGASNVEPYPEAPAMLASMQQGVANGALSSKDAAAQLMALLQQKDQEAQATRARTLVALGKVPPGFGPAPSAAAAPAVPAAQNAPTPSARAPPPGFGHLNSAANPVVPSPAGNSRMAIQPPLVGGSSSPPQQQQQPQLLHQQQGLGGGLGGGLGLGLGGLGGPGAPLLSTSSSRTYSMWSGLPGIDLAASSPLASLWGSGGGAPGPSMHHHVQQQGGAVNGYNPQLGAGAEAQMAFAGAQQQLHHHQQPARAPPPGFGPSPYALQPLQQHPHQHIQSALVSPGDPVVSGGFRPQPYQPLGGGGGGAGGAPRYNPLGQHAMNASAYRPPLGAGL